MLITGIVAEYNPFHNGHLYQIEQTKQTLGSDYIIVVMSGNFTQRAQPTITDKFTRTKMALANGADLVIELPAPFATSSAEYFASASISLLHQTNIVNTLSFGAEIDNMELMYTLAQTLCNEPPELSALIKNHLKEGYSYPTSREKALTCYLQTHTDFESKLITDVVNNPNNILGIEYIKALVKLNSNIKPLAIKRNTSNYHDKEIYNPIASATAIRHNIQQGNWHDIKTAMPPSSFELLQSEGAVPKILNNFSTHLQYKLIFSTLDDLYSLWDVPKNLCHSIHNNYDSHFNFEDLVDKLTSKTYSRATVQRALLRILLDFRSSNTPNLKHTLKLPYIRVLGCKKESSTLLSLLNQNANVPVITNLGKQYSTLDHEARQLLDHEIHATKLYHLASKSQENYQSDFKTGIVMG